MKERNEAKETQEVRKRKESVEDARKGEERRGEKRERKHS